MLEIDPIFKKQMLAFSQKANQKSIYVFSEFLTLNEQAALPALGICNVSCWGGCDTCERKMARFGDPAFMGYEEPFPIACLKITPRNKNYAENFTHRDLLGAVMNLGIRRSVIGDIFLAEDAAYIFCTPAMAEFIASSLEKVRHTYVDCSVCGNVPETLACSTKNKRVNVASERADAVVAAVYSMSRGESIRYFEGQRVFINDSICENGSRQLHEGDRVTVRGYGKFIYRGIQAQTKKGRFYIEAELYSN